MTNALITLEPKNLTELKGVAEVFATSGMFDDARDMARAFVKIMAGREIGLGAFAAMQSVYIVNGKSTYASNAIARALKRNPRYDYRVAELTAEVCEICFYEDGEQVGIERLTMEDAKNADWNKANGKVKDTWKKFPRNMLFARALTNGARFYCPDAFDIPIYTPDELDAEVGEVDEDVIHGELVEEPAPAPTPPTTTPTQPQRDETPAASENGAGSGDHWWHDNKRRQQFWITNNQAGRTKLDVAMLFGIKPSVADNFEAQEWFDVMQEYSNPGEALAALLVKAKAEQAPAAAGQGG